MKEVSKILSSTKNTATHNLSDIANPVYCPNGDVNIESIEDIVGLAAPAIDFYNNVIELDLSDPMFDVKKLYNEAQKAGLDIGDLEEYGFDYSKMRLNVDNYQEFKVKLNNLSNNIWNLLSGKMYEDYQKA